MILFLQVFNWSKVKRQWTSGDHAEKWTNWPLVTDESVEFEKQLVIVQDFRRITCHFSGIYRIYLDLIKKINQKLMICNQLDLETLGSQLISVQLSLWTPMLRQQVIAPLLTKWIGWVWETAGWSSRLSRELPIISAESMEYTSN